MLLQIIEPFKVTEEFQTSDVLLITFFYYEESFELVDDF